MSQKQQLRAKYRLLRQQLSDRAAKSEQIFQRLIGLPEYQRAQRIAIYANLPDEVATDTIIQHALTQQKQVFLPKVTGQTMDFYQIQRLDELALGAYQIREPQDTSCPLLGAPDLIIVPGLGFDQQGNRLGFGGGYYDKYLAVHATFAVALAFDAQISDAPLPTDPHDIKMSCIVTETAILRQWDTGHLA